jgi:hypothetical protein
MDLFMDYETVRELHNRLNEQEFLEMFRKMFPDHDLYGYGEGWLNSKDYLLKFKGTNGDILVCWKN